MNPSDIEKDLGLLKECEFVRYEWRENLLFLLFVMDNEEEEEEHFHCHHHDDDEEEEEEGHDCCMEGLNGHLFLVTFRGVSDFVSKGELCDSYVLRSMKNDDHALSFDYEGHNFFEDDQDLAFSFRYDSYVVEDQGKIASPQV